jgi:hypothetical protein
MMSREADKRAAHTPVVGMGEMIALGIRLSLWTTLRVALLMAPFLLWGFFWDGVVPALMGHGDAGLYREGHALAEGRGIRLAFIVMLAVPPYVMFNTLPIHLERLIRSRIGANPTGESSVDSSSRVDVAQPVEDGIFRLSPDADLTASGIPDHRRTDD